MDKTLKAVDRISKYVPVSEKEYLKAIKEALIKVQLDLKKTRGAWSRRRMNEIIKRLEKELSPATIRWLKAFPKDMFEVMYDFNKATDVFYTLDDKQIKSILSFKEIYFHTTLADGSSKHSLVSVDDLLKNTHLDTVKRVNSIIRTGAITGANPNNIVDEVGNIYGIEKAHLRTTVRTMFADAQNRVHMRHLYDNRKYFECYEYVAKLDSRTTEICRATDETKWQNYEDIPKDLFPPLHPNCRSIIIGKVKCSDKIDVPNVLEKVYEHPKDGKCVKPSWLKSSATISNIKKVTGLKTICRWTYKELVE